MEKLQDSEVQNLLTKNLVSLNETAIKNIENQNVFMKIFFEYNQLLLELNNVQELDTEYLKKYSRYLALKELVRLSDFHLRKSRKYIPEGK